MKSVVFIVVAILSLAILLSIASYNFDNAPGNLTPDNTGESGGTPSTEYSDAESTSNVPTTVEKAPDFTVVDENGNDVKRSDLVGKPMVVLFWQSKYTYSRQELAALQECYAEYADDVVFMAVCIVDGKNETMESAKAFLEDNQFDFPIYFDVHLEVYNTYDLSYRTHLFTKDGALYKYTSNVISAETLKEGIEMILH